MAREDTSKAIIGRYDSITSLFALHEIADVGKALDDLYRHLNENGRLMIYEFRKKGKAKMVFEGEARTRFWGGISKT